MSGMRRRDVLAAGLAGLAVAGAAPALAVRTRPRGSAPARNVIFMVSDGMSTGTLTLADTVSRRRRGKPAAWTQLWRRPGARRAIADTTAADSLVTDSAAGSTAWSIGERVNNGALNVLPDGAERRPILLAAHELGRATGVVTTTRVTHATPAGFYANISDRERESQIGVQLAERPIDVALGGGGKYLPPDSLRYHTDRPVVRDRNGLQAVLERAAPPERVVGIFAESHVPYVLDRGPSIPSLAEMTRLALRVLDARRNGFVLQIEGGRVDHAAHANDAPSLIAEQIDFDDAIAEVLTFLEGRDDTLLVITSDHGTGNPGLTVYGPEGARRLDRTADAHQALESAVEPLAKIKVLAGGMAHIEHMMESSYGVTLNDDEKDMVRRALSSERVAPFVECNGIVSILGGILANSYGIAFVSPNHTSDWVEVTAYGPGADGLNPVINNTDLCVLVSRAIGAPIRG